MILHVGTHEDPTGIAIAGWFASKVGEDQHGPFSAMGWADEDGRLISAALFNDFTGANLEIHIVGKMTRQTMRDAFRYCFTKLGILRLTAKPRRSNKPLLKMLPKIGFAFEATLRSYYGPQRGDDALVFRLEREQALKWMN